MSKLVRTIRVKRLQCTSQAKLLKTLQCGIANRGELESGQSYLEGRLSPVIFQDFNNRAQQPNSNKLNMDRRTSVFQALICTIIAGAEVKVMKFRTDRLNQDIYTSSKNGVSLHDLASNSETSKIMKNCATFLNTFEKKNNLVPGHSGINDVLEKLAKAGLKEVFIDPKALDTTPHNLAKLIIRDQCIEASQNIWRQANSLGNSKVLINAYSTKHCRKAMALSKNSFRIVTKAFMENCDWDEHMSSLKLSKTRDSIFRHEGNGTSLPLLRHYFPQIGIRNSNTDRYSPQSKEVKAIGGKKIIQFLNTIGLGSEVYLIGISNP